MWSSFLSSPKEAANTQQIIKQMNRHNPKGVLSEAPGPTITGLLQRDHIAWNNNVPSIKNPNDNFIL